MKPGPDEVGREGVPCLVPFLIHSFLYYIVELMKPGPDEVGNEGVPCPVPFLIHQFLYYIVELMKPGPEEVGHGCSAPRSFLIS